MKKHVILLSLFTFALHVSAKVNNIVPSSLHRSGFSNVSLPAGPAVPGSFGQSVMSFIENKGQVKDQDGKRRTDIQYSLHAGNNLNIFIGDGAIHYQFSRADKPAAQPGNEFYGGLRESIENNPGNYTMYRMDVDLVGANRHAKVITEEQQSYYENYFSEMTGSKGLTAHSFNKITYKDVYPSIDWVLYTSNGTLKHEFVVRPGGKVSDIKLKYGGATDLHVNENGSLLAATPLGTITEEAPSTYQQNGKPVKSSFSLAGNVLSYETGAYDGTLVIDPSIGWATYYFANSNAYGLAADPAGNVYLTGIVQSPGVATTGAYQTTYMGGDDTYVAKFTTCGVLVWATYFGGTGQEVSTAITIDQLGNLYITGCTRSSTGVTTPGCYQSTFVSGAGQYHVYLAKFTNAGGIVWSTYYGGNSIDQAFGVTLDKTGNVYISGTTRSTTGIATPGADQTSIVGLGDAFIAKFTVGGAMVWATYFGGNSYEQGTGVTVDRLGNPYLAGVTISPSGVSTPGSAQPTFGGGAPGIAYDAYLAKYNAAGVKQWATYYGGTGNEQSHVSAVADTFDGIYISGYTNGNNGISTPGAYQTTPIATTNAFIAKYSTSGALRWGTYFGGNGGSYGYGLVMTDSQHLYITGGTYSSTGMVTPGAYKSTLSGSYDAYIGRFDTGGKLKMCTYVGGNANDDAYYIAAHDSAVFICGNTTSTDFATPGAYQSTTVSGGAYLMRLDLGVSNTIMAPITGGSGICAGSTVTLSDTTPHGVWSSGTTAIATVSPSGVVTGVSAGTAVISYTITNFCGSRSVMDTMTIFPTASVITGNTKICVGSTTLLSDPVSGGTWMSSNTMVATVPPGAGMVTGVAAGTAVITYVLGASCDANVTVTVVPATGITGPSTVCTGSVITMSNPTSGGTWSSSSTSVASIGSTGTTTAAIIGAGAGTATITYTINPGCDVMKTLTVNLTPSAISGASSVCNASTITLSDPTPGGAWSSANTTIATVNSSTGDVTGTSKGSVNIIYTSVEGCTVFKSVTVLPIQPIIGPASICVGAVMPFIDSVTGGTWTSSNTTVATVGLTSGNVSALAVGSTTINYVLASGCSANVVLFVNPAPTAISGAGTICGTAVAAYSDGLPGGTWTSSNTSIATVDASLGLATGTGFGTTTIYYSLGPGCTVSKPVTVSPAARAITGANNLCAGGTYENVSTLDVPMGIWTSTLVTVTPGGLVYAAAAGTATITYTLPSGCFTTTTLTVNSLPGTITGPPSLCVGGLIMMSDSTTGGTWGTVNTTVLVDAGIGAVAGISPGTAAITYTAPGTGCTVSDTITVFPAPSSVLGTSDICLGTTTILSDVTKGGTWSVAPGGVATIGAFTGSLTALAAGTTTVTYTAGPGCTATLTVSVIPLPSLYSVTGGGSYCAGGTGVHVKLSGSSTGIKYYLYFGTFLSDSLRGTGSLLDYGLQIFPGAYTVVATDTNTMCSNNMSGGATVSTNPVLVPVVTIGTAPNDTICAGSTATYIAKATNGGSAPVYQWKVNSVNVGSSSNTYSYTPNDGDLVSVAMTSNAICADPVMAYNYLTMSVVTPVVPDVTVSADPGTYVPAGTNVTFTAVINNSSLLTSPTYQWMRNNVAVAGQTKATYSSKALANLDVITCNVSSGGLCSQTGTSNKENMVVYVIKAAVDVLSAGIADIRVVPNPTKGAFTVEGSLGSASDMGASLELTDMLGQVVYRSTVVAKAGYLDELVQPANALASGMYLLNVRSGSVNKVLHIVIAQ